MLEDDLEIVQAPSFCSLAVWEGRNEWRNLGTELGISQDILEAISQDHPQSINDCFREMLSV